MATSRADERSAPESHRRRWWILALAFVALLAMDVSRPPANQISAQLLIGGIRLYRRTLSPWMPVVGARCRFEPSCSRYAEASIQRHGALLGGARAAGRLVRCGPWTPHGTLDPPLPEPTRDRRETSATIALERKRR